VPGISESGSPRAGGVPRWVFIAWLWAVVAYELLDEFKLVCRNWSPDWPCRSWRLAAWVFGLSPGELGAFAAYFFESPFYMLPVVLAGAALTWAALRFLPALMTWRASITLVVAWYILSFVGWSLWVLSLGLPYLRH